MVPGTLGRRSSCDLDDTGGGVSAPPSWGGRAPLMHQSVYLQGSGGAATELQLCVPRELKKMRMADTLEIALGLGKRNQIPLLQDVLTD